MQRFLLQWRWAALLAFVFAAAPAAGEDFEERVEMPEGGKLRVELDGGRIEVDSHDDASVEIEGRVGGSGFDFEVDRDDDTLTIKGSRSGFLPIFGPKVRLHVRVPTRFDLDLRTSGGRIDIEEIIGEVIATTSGGPIEAQRIDGDVELTTSGGRIRVREIRGEVEARTSGGPIHVSEVDGAVEAETSGGTVRVRDAAGPVEVETSGGAVDVRFTGTPRGELKTSGGSIEVDVPGDARFDLDAETSGGRVTIADELRFDGELERSEAEGEINGGGDELELRTSGGNIRIRIR